MLFSISWQPSPMLLPMFWTLYMDCLSYSFTTLYELSAIIISIFFFSWGAWNLYDFQVPIRDQVACRLTSQSGCSYRVYTACIPLSFPVTLKSTVFLSVCLSIHQSIYHLSRCLQVKKCLSGIILFDVSFPFMSLRNRGSFP